MKKIEINIPDAKSGNWSVESFTIQPRELSQMVSLLTTGRGVPAGNYKRLMRNGTCVMSNTPDEIRDFSNFLYNAKGKILINGLGLGVLVKALLEKEEVTEITVIEISTDVIKLVGEFLKDDRLKIINADAFEYKPPKGEKYNYVWHDIWDDITSENLPEMSTLHRKYGRRTDYQESWCRHECEKRKKDEKKYCSYYY